MNAPIKKVAAAAAVLFLALLINANYLQVVDAAKLRDNPQNSRLLLLEYSEQRGPIVVGGQEVARSVATNDSLKYLRLYPGGAEYAPVTGFYSLVYGATGIEQAENSILSGDDDRLFTRRLADYFTGRTPQGGAVVLTLNPKAQLAAWQAMQGKRGAVVAVDPSTGAILALVTSPSYDPALLSTHNTGEIRRAYATLLADPSSPMLDRALDQTFPPGSMFKVVTASAAFSSGQYQPSTVVPAPTELKLPLTSVYLHNFGNESCGNGQTDTVIDAFTISCNTAFAGIGLHLGATALRAQAEAFGFDNGLSVPLTVATSRFPANPDAPQTALSAIGQFDDEITPLQAALLSAAIANGGVVMQPYLVQRVEAPDASVLEQATPQVWRRAVSPSVAALMTQLMVSVVAHGTGTPAQIPGVVVAGKTGTAQHGTGLPPDAWFTAFAPVGAPRVAVAVIVEDGGGNTEATGGAVAAPIAKAVIEAVLSS